MAALVASPTQAAAEDDVGNGEVLPASYDVIIVPRNDGRAPRVLTDRGWRTLAPRTPVQRFGQNWQRRDRVGRGVSAGRWSREDRWMAGQREFESRPPRSWPRAPDRWTDRWSDVPSERGLPRRLVARDRD